MTDLFPEKPGKSDPLAVYRYTDAAGNLLYEVCRFPPKEFRQRRPLGPGWSWDVTGVPRVPFRLPELQGVATVVVVEGERDANTLWGLNIPATTNAGGAKKWRQAETAALKAAGCQRVVILPDNDAAGKAHAAQVYDLCQKAGMAAQVIALPGLGPHGDVSEWLDGGGSVDGLRRMIEQGGPWTPSRITSSPVAVDTDDASHIEGRTQNVKASQSKVLVDMAIKDLELWHTPRGEAYATVVVNGHREHHQLRKVVKDYLARVYYRSEGRVASAQALTDATNTLGGIARYDGPEYPVSVRLAGNESALYLDLGTPQWEVVEVTADGWHIVAGAPVRHWRPGSLRPLPMPVVGGSLEALRELWPNADDNTWTLIVSWLIATLQPKGPYPILIETGEQGSGKSTLGRMVRGLIDPSAPELRGVPRDERDVMIGALTSHVVALDNLSGLPVWLSDALCRIATGGGLATRTLYSDTDETLIDVARPILLTGIDSPATRGDLLDRALVVHLPAMLDEARGDEATLWHRYDALRPQLVGALLDAAVSALRHRNEVSLPKAPRMKDACLWVMAAEPALGWAAGRTVTTWLGARADASADLLAGDAVAQALLTMPLPWSGTATELLTKLTELVPDRPRASRPWAASPRSLSIHLKRLTPDLRRSGIEVTDYREGHTGRRMLRIVTTVTRVTEAGDLDVSGHGAGDDFGDPVVLRHPTVTAQLVDQRPNSASGDDGDAGDSRVPALSVRSEIGSADADRL